MFTAGISAVGYGKNSMQGPKSKPKYSEDAHDVSKVNTSGWTWWWWDSSEFKIYSEARLRGIVCEHSAYTDSALSWHVQRLIVAPT